MFHQLIFNPLCLVFMHIFWHKVIHIYIYMCVFQLLYFQWDSGRHSKQTHTHADTSGRKTVYHIHTQQHWPIKNDWIHNGHEYLLHSLVLLVLIPLRCIIIGKLLIAPSKDAWNESSVCNSVSGSAAVMDKFIFWWATNNTTTKPRNLVNISNPPYQIQRNIIR